MTSIQKLLSGSATQLGVIGVTYLQNLLRTEVTPTLVSYLTQFMLVESGTLYICRGIDDVDYLRHRYEEYHAAMEDFDQQWQAYERACNETGDRHVTAPVRPLRDRLVRGGYKMACFATDSKPLTEVQEITKSCNRWFGTCSW
jgi:hypothetical protein